MFGRTGVNYKRNLVSTLTTRVFNICSNFINIDLKLQFLKQTLYLNGFSEYFTDTYIGKQLTKLINPPIPKINVPRDIIYFPISFMGKNSFSFKNKLTKLLKEFYSQVTIRIIFKSNYTIKRLFKFKDRLPFELQSSVIYKYECHCCHAMYYGKTKRQLRVRIFEHLGRSLRTNMPLRKPPYSAIRDHSRSCDHPIHLKNFTVMSSRSYDTELSII